MNDEIRPGGDLLGGSTAGMPVARKVIEHELRHLQQEWWWFLVLGILLVLSGVVAIGYPAISSVAIVVVLGMCLLISGVATIVATFWAGRWSAHLLQLLIGIFYAVVGFLIMDKPLESTASLTLVVAAMFIVVGIMRSVAALTIRYPQWGWSLLSGILATLIGLMIYKSFPETALWAIGTLVGIQLIFDGWFWIMLAIALRRLPAGR
ncbi:MAG TPA: HdeD family acid-resistance protein [Pirellulaceae bacterium]|jgi:uncharacterized membrane protein HdeD (DUF308 family)